ncbi:unnamed protein product, partial [Polarella glacialis]
MAGFSSGPASYAEHDGDQVVRRSSAFVLGCGTTACALAVFGCLEPVLSLLFSEMGWLLLAPALLIVVLGAVGLCASRGDTSKLFRAQLAVFMLIMASLLAGAGVFAYLCAGVASRWIFDGCIGFRTS